MLLGPFNLVPYSYWTRHKLGVSIVFVSCTCFACQTLDDKESEDMIHDNMKTIMSTLRIEKTHKIEICFLECLKFESSL